MMRLALRHLRWYWRDNLAGLGCLTLACMLLASLSGHVAGIASQELYRTLATAQPAERSLLITGTPYTFSATLFENLRTRLGETFKERLEIRHTTLEADPKQNFAHIEVYSFDQLAGHVRILEGRLPEQIRLNEATGAWPPPVEAVIGLDAVRETGYGIGDRVTASGLYHRLDIVGIIEPLDADEDAWGGDLSAFDIEPDVDPGTRSLPLIIAPTSMRSYLDRPLFPHEISWRITLDIEHIRTETVQRFRSDLINFQSQSATSGARLNTGLVQILADYRARLAPVRIIAFLLVLQTLILVAFTLTTLSAYRVERLQVELATFASHGVGPWQVTPLFALENMPISLISSLILGPALAQAVLHACNSNPAGMISKALPSDAWLLACLVGGAGWLALVLPAFLAVRRGGPTRQLDSFDLPQQAFIQRYYVDLYLLAAGGLLYWQLNQSGSFLMQKLEGIQLADPLLLAGPMLLTFASALVAVRFLPILVRPAARFAERRRGTVLHLGLYRLVRDPLQAGRLLLLVSLTTVLVVFNHLFRDALTAGPSDSLFQGISSVLRFNTLTLGLFSVTVFFLLQFFIAQERTREFNLLYCMGLKKWQRLFILAVECAPVLVLGLLVGAVLGLGLFFILTPYLSEALSIALPGWVAVNWPAVAQLCIVLFFVYGSALFLSLIVLAAPRYLDLREGIE